MTNRELTHNSWRALPLLALAFTSPVSVSADERPSSRDIAFWEQQVAFDAEGAIARARLAGAYLERFRESEDAADATRAEASARSSLRIRARGNLEAAANLTESLLSQHRFADALVAARAQMTLAPGDIQTLRRYAEVLLEVGDYDEFRRHLDSWSASTDDPSVLATLARWKLLTGEGDEAVRLFEQAQTLVDRGRAASPSVVAWFHRHRGDALASLGRTADAERAYRQALTVCPDDAKSLYPLARLALARGDVPRALTLSQRAAALLPHPEMLGLVGDAYMGLGRHREAARQYDLVWTSRPRSEEGIVLDRHLAMFWADHGQHLDEAYALAQRELNARRDVYAYDTLAWVCLKKGLVPEAAALMPKALQLGTRDSYLRYHAGMIAAASGDRAAARTHLVEALRLNPSFIGATEARRTLGALR